MKKEANFLKKIMFQFFGILTTTIIADYFCCLLYCLKIQETDTYCSKCSPRFSRCPNFWEGFSPEMHFFGIFVAVIICDLMPRIWYSFFS